MSKRDLKSRNGPEGAAGETKPAPKRTTLPPDYRPRDDEPFMNDRQRLYFRQKLMSWREEIVEATRETLDVVDDHQHLGHQRLSSLVLFRTASDASAQTSLTPARYSTSLTPPSPSSATF